MSMFTANGTIVLGDRLEQCYDGETDDGGLRHGHGVYTYANRTFKYEGEYVKGEKNGKGRLTLSDGSYFEGTFERDEIVGHGVRVYSDGSRYEGLFHDGEATGQGTYSSSQGWKVQAQFAGNRPIGHGKWENVAGDTYEGNFVGKFEGQGTLRRSDGYVYTGCWKGGQKHGQGVEELADESYSGDFCDGQRYGIGTLRTADGRTYSEMAFCNGRMQETAGRLFLEYPKNVDKKGNELPIALDVGARVPAQFTVHVSVQSQGSISGTVAADAQPQPDAAAAGTWQNFVKESGRRIIVRLHHGHPQPGEELQEQVPGDVLGVWTADRACPEVHGDASSGNADDSQATEQVMMVPEICLSTDSGASSLSNFQVGGGTSEVLAGPYTLAFSSDGLADETMAVTVGPQGKGK